MSHAIPTVDLSPFFTTSGDIDEDGKKKAKDLINEACSTFGFFQIVNHGVPLELMKRAMEASKTFFNLPDEEKLMIKSSPALGAPLRSGYNERPKNSADNGEHLLMFPPGSTFNVLLPQNPPNLKKTVAEDLFSSLVKTAKFLEAILAECLGLPPNILHKFNDDRSWDALVAWRGVVMTTDHHHDPPNYYIDNNNNNNGLSEHEDGNVFTLVLQDQVGGLQVKKNDEYIPVIPKEGTLCVNIGDVLQVLSNNKYKSATHRVVTTKVQDRYSYVFFYNLIGEKWVEPLPEFTTLIGKAAEYKGFWYKDYQAMRISSKTNPVSNKTAGDVVSNIKHYSISAYIAS